MSAVIRSPLYLFVALCAAALMVAGFSRTYFFRELFSLPPLTLLLHLHAAYSLTVMNRRSRPVAYQSRRDYLAANFAANGMIQPVTILQRFDADSQGRVQGQLAFNFDLGVPQGPLNLLFEGACSTSVDVAWP